MYDYNGEEIFVIDGHIHMWDAGEQNIIHRGGEEFIQCFYDYHTAFTPEDRVWDLDTEYRTMTAERTTRDLFEHAAVDMAIFSRRISPTSTRRGSIRSNDLRRSSMRPIPNGSCSTECSTRETATKGWPISRTSTRPTTSRA